jgi:hypothetical protein
LHPQRQGLNAREDEECVERRQCGAEVAQTQHAARDREGEIAKGLLNLEPVIFRSRLAQHRIFVVFRPIEGAGIDDDAAERIAVAAEEFGQGVHDDIGAMVDGTDQIGRRQRVVDDQRHARLVGDRGHRLDVGDAATGICDRFDEDGLGARTYRALETFDVVGVGPHHVPAEALEGVGELVDRAAIEFSRGDELIAGHQQLLKHHELRGVAGGGRKRRSAAFEGGDAFLKHGSGRIGDAGIDVAERLQPEQRGGVIGVVENEGCGLIDRRHARAGGGIGLRSGMHGKGRKSRQTISHSWYPAFWLARKSRGGC